MQFNKLIAEINMITKLIVLQVYNLLYLTVLYIVHIRVPVFSSLVCELDTSCINIDNSLVTSSSSAFVKLTCFHSYCSLGQVPRIVSSQSCIGTEHIRAGCSSQSPVSNVTGQKVAR